MIDLRANLSSKSLYGEDGTKGKHSFLKAMHFDLTWTPGLLGHLLISYHHPKKF